VTVVIISLEFVTAVTVLAVIVVAGWLAPNGFQARGVCHAYRRPPNHPANCSLPYGPQLRCFFSAFLIAAAVLPVSARAYPPSRLTAIGELKRKRYDLRGAARGHAVRAIRSRVGK
jgi:hypothetical protein